MILMVVLRDRYWEESKVLPMENMKVGKMDRQREQLLYLNWVLCSAE